MLSLSFEWAKRRVRRLYFPLGEAPFFATEHVEPGVAVGKRFVGVDEPKAMTVDFVWMTRLRRVDAERSAANVKKDDETSEEFYLDSAETTIEFV